LLEVAFGVWNESLKLKIELKKQLFDMQDETKKLQIIVMYQAEKQNIEKL
jgi:hypothetical protein